MGGDMKRPAFRAAFDALTRTLPHSRTIVFPRLDHSGSSDPGPANCGGKPRIVAPAIRSFFAQPWSCRLAAEATAHDAGDHAIIRATQPARRAPAPAGRGHRVPDTTRALAGPGHKVPGRPGRVRRIGTVLGLFAGSCPAWREARTWPVLRLPSRSCIPVTTRSQERRSCACRALTRCRRAAGPLSSPPGTGSRPDVRGGQVSR